MKDVKVLRYVDRVEALWLWWKAIFLCPPWFFLGMPLVGMIALKLGSFPAQVTYVVLLLMGIAYFIEDVLKRKIRIENDVLYFGYRQYKLNEMTSVGLAYKRDHVLPKQMLLQFSSGRTFKLKLSRLSARDFEILLSHIEKRFPSANIDPVIRSLTKCKKLARRSLFDENVRIDIPYNSQKALKDLGKTFMDTGERWGRLGPVLMFLVAAPIWIGVTMGLFLSGSWVIRQNPNLLLAEVLHKFSMKANETLGIGISHTGKFVFHLISNPVAGVLFGLVIVLFLIHILRLLFRPNLFRLEQTGMSKHFSCFGRPFKLAHMDWSGLRSATLIKPGSSNKDNWKIRLEHGDAAKSLSLDLGGLTEEDRIRLLKGIEHWSPGCRIAADLSEALLPKQEKSYTELWLQSLSAPPERNSLEPLEPGQLLQENRYEVVKRLGIGGQGLAYLCRDVLQIAANRKGEVVLKETILPVFVEHAIRTQALERFEQEARMLQKLDCDNIVKLIDFFIEDHRGYLVLEHIEGKNLREVLQSEGPLPEPVVIDLAIQMCEILEYLHGLGIIHRDFTPDNLMLNKDGRLKLIDFNVAQKAQSGSTGTIVGKHAYLPPEQFRGKATLQSDIYAMGGTVFYLLTGKDPEPISESSPADHHAGISDSLNTIVRKCTALQNSKRYQNAAEVGAELRRIDCADDDSNVINVSDALSLEIEHG